MAFAVRCARRIEFLTFDHASKAQDREVIYHVLDFAAKLCVEPRDTLMKRGGLGEWFAARFGRRDKRREGLTEWIAGLQVARSSSSAICSKGIECCCEVARCAQVGCGFSISTRVDRGSDNERYSADLVARDLRRAWAFASNAAVLAFEAAQPFLDISNEADADFRALDVLQFNEQELAVLDSSVRLTPPLEKILNAKLDLPAPQHLFGIMWPDGLPDWVRDRLHQAVPFAARPDASPPATHPTRERVTRDLIAELVTKTQRVFERLELEQLCLYSLGVKLDAVVTTGTPGYHVIFKLVTWADDRGKLRDLAAALSAARNNLPEIVDICQRVIGT